MPLPPRNPPNPTQTRHVTPLPTGMTTRSSERDRPMSIEEINRQIETLRFTPEKARETLVKSQFISKDTPITVHTLSFTLLSLANSAPLRVLQEGTRAIASLIEDIASHKAQADALQGLQDKLSPILEQLNEAAISLESSTGKIVSNTQRQYDTGEDVRVSIETATSDLQEASKKLASTPTHSPPSLTHPTATDSYAAAVARNLPLSHRSNIDKNRTRAVQVLIEPAPGFEQNTLTELNEEEIVAKTNEALKAMDHLNWGDIDPMSAIGARKLKNGGVVVEMNHEGAAQFIRREKQEFLKFFGATAVVKERSIPILIEYVPITCSHESAQHRIIENITQLPPLSIVHMRWIKPPEKRTPGQRVAHLVMRVTSPEIANTIIKDGVVIAGKRVWAKKLMKEPRRCLKCQAFTFKHMAATCDGQNACATCGEDHHTSECTVTDTANFKCKNCNTSGHASWDRTCPEFISECQRLVKNDQESTYRYFPTDQPWTWEQTTHTSNLTDSTDLQPPNTHQLSQQPPPPPRYRGSSWFDGTNHGQNDRNEAVRRGEPQRGPSRLGQNSNPPTGHRDNGWQSLPPKPPPSRPPRPNYTQTSLDSMLGSSIPTQQQTKAAGPSNGNLPNS